MPAKQLYIALGQSKQTGVLETHDHTQTLEAIANQFTLHEGNEVQ